MGCCASAPDVIIPDPTGPCKFAFTRAGTFQGFDCYVMQDSPRGPKWLFVDNDTSGVFNMSTLMNFVPAPPAKKWSKKTGTCLMQARGQYDNALYQFMPWEQYTGLDFEDHTHDFHPEVDPNPFMVRGGIGAVQTVKFTYKSEVAIFMDRDMQRQVGTLYVMAWGRQSRQLEVRTRTVTRDGHSHTETYVHENIWKNIRATKYYYVPVGQPDRATPIVCGGRLREGGDGYGFREAYYSWESEIFRATRTGAEKDHQVDINYSQWCPPSLAIMLAYLTTRVYSPHKIAKHMPRFNYPQMNVPGWMWPV